MRLSRRRACGVGAAVAAVLGIVVLLCVLLAPSEPPDTGAPPPPEPPTAAGPADPTVEALARILDPKLSMEERMRALDKVKRELTEEEMGQLRGLIRQTKLNLAFRNDAVVLAERQKQKPEWLGPELVRMWRDEEESDTWKDYCIQHLEAAYDYAPNRTEIETILMETASGGGRMSGTALLSLERLGKRHPSLAKTAGTVARETVKAEQLDQEAAVTAMQVARAAGDASVLDEARRLAADADAKVRARMSAMGMLGDLGAAEDIPLLRKLCEEKESRISRVARHNLARLASRLGDAEAVGRGE